MSILRRGAGILGFVRSAEKKELHAAPLTYYRNRMKVALAGHVAVDVVMGEPWTGATTDFDHVREYLTAMAMFGEFGGIPFDPGKPFENEATRKTADAYLQLALRHTYKLLQDNRVAIDAMWPLLLEKDELSSTETYALLDKFEKVLSTEATLK